MGVGSLGFAKTRQPSGQQPMRSAKGNCYNERNPRYTQNLSSGSAGFSETKSSHDGSMTEKSDKDETSSRNGDQENKDSEPEWFTCPASRFDVIELHGFEDGLDEAKIVNSKPEGRSSMGDSTSRMGFDDFVRYSQQQQNEVASSAYRKSSYNQPTRYPRTYNNPLNSNFFNNKNNNSARFRNPLHQSNCKFQTSCRELR